MSKKEKIKVKLDMLKTMIMTFITTLFGVLGYTILNYEIFNKIITISVLIAIALLILGVLILAKEFKKELKRLEEEE